MAKQVRFVSQPTVIDGQSVSELAVFDADGNPVDLAGSSGGTITSVKATGLAAGATPTATLADGVLTLGIPAGAKGDPGAAGAPGKAGTNGTNGAAGVGVKSLALTADASGKITGGTLTLTNNTTSPVTVTTATA
ncbi:hypothetical protein D2E25_0250 [Bifidobacterium goeldii]|uniref:Uncharacterized protein n=1 Tax=Bifidobacterium goeldii TaxID=2306975 RepID=A0A430FM15_9BIFI|nr:hypothetical protein [Bifidobacterium goeldii]RSX53944.1 hypothetical protein D2E25_0250 [Bifidobacterium goeldii]